MPKNVLTKKRSGDENIGKLIVFAVTIIIAVGVLGTLAYFYNQSRQTATQMSVLTSTSSSAADLGTMGFCPGTTDNYVEYDPISDKYGLVCSGSVTNDNLTKVKEVHGIINATLLTTPANSGALSGAQITYKVNR